MRKNLRQLPELHKINLQNILDIEQNYYFYICGNIAVLVTG